MIKKKNLRKILAIIGFLIGPITLIKGQHVYQIRADSVRIYNVCDTAELIIENRTRGVSGYLYNKGNGRTEFRELQLAQVGSSRLAIIGQDTIDLAQMSGVGGIDTIYREGDSIRYVKRNVITSLYAPTDGNFKQVSVQDSIWLNGNWIKGFSDDSAFSAGSTALLPTQSAVKRSIAAIPKPNLQTVTASGNTTNRDLILGSPWGSPAQSIQLRVNQSGQPDVAVTRGIRGMRVGIDSIHTAEVPYLQFMGAFARVRLGRFENEPVNSLSFNWAVGASNGFTDRQVFFPDGTIQGSPAIAANQFVTRQQITDTVSARISGIPIYTLNQILSANNDATSADIDMIGDNRGIGWWNGLSRRWLMRQEANPANNFGLYSYSDAGTPTLRLLADRTTGVFDFFSVPTRAGYTIWDASNHPAGSAFTMTYSGAEVPATATYNISGHATAQTKRNLTPADIGAVPGNATNFIQNSTIMPQAKSFRLTGYATIQKNGSAGFSPSYQLVDAANSGVGANIQLNGDPVPGVDFYVYNNGWDRRLTLSADGSFEFPFLLKGTTLNNITALQNFTASGTLSIENVPALGTAATKYITTTGVSGEVQSRTAAQVLADIAAAPSSGSANYIRNTMTQQTADFNITGNGIVGGQLTSSVAGGQSAVTARSTSTGDALIVADVTGVSTGRLHTFRAGGRTGIFSNSIEAMTIAMSGRVGLNNTNPLLGQFHITTTGTEGLAIQNTAAVSASTGAFARFYQSGTPSANEHRLGGLLFGSNPTGSTIRTGGQIDFVSDGVWTDGSSHPTQIKFLLTPSASAAPAEVARITSTGKLKLTNHITSTGAIVSGLPTNAGDLSSTLDANINFVVKNENTGGGIYTTALQALNGAESATGYVRVDATRISVPELIMQGAMSPGYAALPANTTLGNYSNVAATVGGLTFTLPTIASAPGREYTIFHAGPSGTVILNAGAGNTINGAASFTLTAPNKTITVWNHGGASTAWHIKYSN